MPVRTPCPDCAAPLDIVEKLDGKQVRCPECGRVFVFTLPVQPAAPEERATVEPIDAPPVETKVATQPKPAGVRSWGSQEDQTHPQKSSGGLALALMLGAGALVLLLLGGGFLIGLMMWRSAVVRYDYDIAPNVTAARPPALADERDLVEQPLRLNPGDLPAPPAPSAIRPPHLDQDRTEIALDLSVSDVVVGGGGRYLVLKQPHEKQIGTLAIFDVCQAKVIHEVPLLWSDVKLAASMDKLVIATDRELQRYDLATNRLEDVIPLPFQEKVKTLAMGHSSNGPLLVGLENRPSLNRPAALLAGQWALMDVRTFRVIAPESQLPAHGFGPIEVHAAPDGRLFCLSSLEGGLSAERMTLALLGNEVRVFHSKRPVVDAWTGWSEELVYAGREATAARMNRETRPVFGQPHSIPAHDGPYFLRLGPEPNPKNPFPREGEPLEPVTVHRVGLSKPLASFNGLLAGMPRDQGPKPECLSLPRRVHYLPQAKVIVTLPGTGNRLLVQKFDAEDALSKLEGLPLHIVSEPPLAAPRGGRFSYQLDVRSGKGEVKRRLMFGPPGMQLAPDGRLTWNVPPALRDFTTAVVVSLREADGRETFHSFHLHHPGSDPAGDQGSPPEPPPPGPLTIKPPKLAEQPLTVQLPAPAAGVTVGGGGRYLILTMPKVRQLAVFDVNAAKIVKEIPMAEEHVLTAAGLDRLVVVLPRQRLLERWNLTTLTREAVAPLPPWNAIKRIAMGSASNGPLLVQWATGFDALDPGGHDFLDIFTAKRYPTRWTGQVPHVSFRDEYEIRASADGKVFTMWATSHNPEGLHCLVRNGDMVAGYHEHADCFHLIPAPDGRTLYTGFERLNQNLRPLADRGPGGGGRRAEQGPLLIPALQGDYHLSIEPGVQFVQPEKGSSVFVHSASLGRRLFQVPNLDVGVQDERRHRQDSAYDRRLHFIPAAKVLIFLPTGNDRLVLHQVDVNAPPGK